MEFTHILAFNLALLAAIASPGPSILFLLRSSLANGRQTGLITGLGLGVMAALWTLMALLGLDGLFRLFPWAYMALKSIGALYLIYIAINLWRHARQPVATDVAQSNQRAFLSGMLVNLGNPKSVIFAAAVILVIFPPILTASEKALIFGNHLVIELIVQSALALLFSTKTVTKRYLNAKPILDRIAAGVLGALGLRLLTDR